MHSDRFAVSVKDADGAYVRANDVFLTLLGVTAEDLAGMRDDQLLPRELAATVAANDAAALASTGPLLVDELVFDRVGRRRVAACRFVAAEDGATVLWRVSGPPEQAGAVAAEAERLRASSRPAEPAVEQEDPTAAPTSFDQPTPFLDRERARERAEAFSRAHTRIAELEEALAQAGTVGSALEEACERIGRLEADLAEARSQVTLPNPRAAAALRALEGIAAALEHPLAVDGACRVAAERLARALGFDAAVTWKSGRLGDLVCSSVWTALEADDVATSRWRSRRPRPGELTWEETGDEHGMRTAVTVPLGDAGALELLAHERREPEPETLQALRAAASQLVLVQRLTEMAQQPRWTFMAQPRQPT